MMKNLRRVSIACLCIKVFDSCKHILDTSENDTDNVKTTTPKRTKRIKLLVDIDISPGGSSKVVHVATRNEIMDESPPSWILQFLSKCSLTVVR
jgi:hypothetical protein